MTATGDGDCALPEAIVHGVNVGVVVVDPEYTIVRWNRFMAVHSGIGPDAALGRNLFSVCPELPQRWLEQKLRRVFVLRHYAFTSWQQRPYLFRFPHNRPATAGLVEAMRQDCTFIPIKNDAQEVTHVCITVMDVTDTCIYELRMRQAMGELEEMSNRDPLTGIFNRRHLEDRLRTEFARSRRHEHALSVVMFDIDYFKPVNDRYGHMAGDEVLRELVRRVTGSLREEDICGRYGGEEFTVILPNTDLPAAVVAAERLRGIVADKPVECSAGTVTVTITLGVAHLHPALDNHDILLDAADQALYRGKSQGRNRVMTLEDSGPRR